MQTQSDKTACVHSGSSNKNIPPIFYPLYFFGYPPYNFGFLDDLKKNFANFFSKIFFAPKCLKTTFWAKKFFFPKKFFFGRPKIQKNRGGYPKKIGGSKIGGGLFLLDDPEYP